MIGQALRSRYFYYVKMLIISVNYVIIIHFGSKLIFMNQIKQGSDFQEPKKPYKFDFNNRLGLPYSYTESHPGQKYKFTEFKLFFAFSSVMMSQFLVSKTIGQWIFGNLYEKGSKTEDKKLWVKRQSAHLLKIMIRYNSIIFGTKVLLDQYYSQTLKKNQDYYQSNTSLHYKIGALVGFIAYMINIPIGEFYSRLSINKLSPKFILNQQPRTKFDNLERAYREFFSLECLKRIVNNFSFISLSGVVLFRTIYFGVYQKVKNKYPGPLIQYLVAPLLCSSLSLIVSPLDQIKLLQITSHKGKSFHEIILEKGFQLWNISGQKIYTSIIKQSLSLSFFVGGQNFCKYIINNKQVKY